MHLGNNAKLMGRIKPAKENDKKEISSHNLFAGFFHGSVAYLSSKKQRDFKAATLGTSPELSAALYALKSIIFHVCSLVIYYL